MKMVKSLLLGCSSTETTIRSGPKFGPGSGGGCIEENSGIEGAGFGIYPDTEERELDAGSIF